MSQHIIFNKIEVKGNKTHFITDHIRIIAGRILQFNGSHRLMEPYTAMAYLACGRENYIVINTAGIAVIEDWYAEELWPKYQMLDLLHAEIDEEDTGV